MKTIILFILLLLLNNSKAQTVFQDSIAPTFEIKTWINNASGNAILKNKPIILEFWSTTCGPCIKAIPHVNKLHNRYKQDISFISVNSFDKNEKIKKFLIKHNIENSIAVDAERILYKQFDVKSIPVTIIIDKKGFIRWKGLASELNSEMIDKFLNKDIIDLPLQGIIFDKKFTLQLDDKIEYQLKVEYGDNTTGNTVGYEFDEEFEFFTFGKDLFSILPQLTNWFNIENEWEYKATNLKQNVLNIYIKSHTTLVDEEDRKKVIKDVIIKLSEHLNFDIANSNVEKETWFMVPDTIALKKHLSINQELDYKLTRTEELISCKNIFFEYLVQTISRNTDERIKIDRKFLGKYYDLSIPKTNDFQVIQKYFKDNYTINFIKKDEIVKLRTVTFK